MDTVFESSSEVVEHLECPDDIIIIGAGGVALHAAPVMLNLLKFKTEAGRSINVTIYDKDTFEEKNMDRQIYNKALIGMGKAEFIQAKFKEFADSDLGNKVHIDVVEDWFHGGVDIPSECALFCFADNNAAYAACLSKADEFDGVEVFRGANEYEGADAIYYNNTMSGCPNSDPRVRFPEILTDKTDDPMVSENCTGEATESAPQLSLANQEAASLTSKLIWCRWGEASALDEKDQPVGFSSNSYETTTIRRNG